jgi:hypothetical protein
VLKEDADLAENGEMVWVPGVVDIPCCVPATARYGRCLCKFYQLKAEIGRRKEGREGEMGKGWKMKRKGKGYSTRE